MSGTALNVTVQSYNGRMDYGLIACRRAVPDITEIGDYLLAEHQLLMSLTQTHPAEAPKAAAPEPAPVAKAAAGKTPARKVAAKAPASKAPPRKPAVPAKRARAAAAA